MHALRVSTALLQGLGSRVGAGEPVPACASLWRAMTTFCTRNSQPNIPACMALGLCTPPPSHPTPTLIHPTQHPPPTATPSCRRVLEERELRQCSSCQDVFCAPCSVLDYSLARVDQVFCLECLDNQVRYAGKSGGCLHAMPAREACVRALSRVWGRVDA